MFLWWCGGVFVVVWLCFCDGVVVICGCVVVILRLRFCRGVCMVESFCGGVVVSLWL